MEKSTQEQEWTFQLELNLMQARAMVRNNTKDFYSTIEMNGWKNYVNKLIFTKKLDSQKLPIIAGETIKSVEK